MLISETFAEMKLLKVKTIIAERDVDNETLLLFCLSVDVFIVCNQIICTTTVATPTTMISIPYTYPPRIEEFKTEYRIVFLISAIRGL